MDHDQKVATAFKVKCFDINPDARTCVFKACALLPIDMSVEDMRANAHVLPKELVDELATYAEDELQLSETEDEKEMLKNRELVRELSRDEERDDLEGGGTGGTLGDDMKERFTLLADNLEKTREKVQDIYGKALKTESKAAYDHAVQHFTSRAATLSTELLERGKRALTSELMKHLDKNQHEWKPHYEQAASNMRESALGMQLGESWRKKLGESLEKEHELAVNSVKDYVVSKAPQWKRDFVEKAKDAAEILGSWSSLKRK